MGEKLRVLVGRYKEKHSSTHIYVETGRYSVGKAGVYAAKVVDKKTSYGKTFVVLAAYASKLVYSRKMRFKYASRAKNA